MARSNYIYIISYSPYDGVWAAFTVKHEMISFLENIILTASKDGYDSYLRDLKKTGELWHVQRVKDGTEEVNDISKDVGQLLLEKFCEKKSNEP